LELKTTPAESLKQAVPADKWDEYCLKLEENARVQEEKARELQLQESQLQIQQLENEMAEKETARLKQLQGMSFCNF
jgi:hypothetical protein